MAEEELQTMILYDSFYRDGFGRVLFIMGAIVFAIVILMGVALYLYFSKPPPITFSVSQEWRIQPPVPIDKPYLTTPDMLQWVSDALPKAFTYDFNHYNDQLKVVSQYFTSDGWKVFLNQLNNYANYNNVQTDKLFVSGTAAGAPYILNQGLLSGRYGWWVQMPIDIDYEGGRSTPAQTITLQVLVVRVSTLNNLLGIGIDNVVVINGAGNQQQPPASNG